MSCPPTSQTAHNKPHQAEPGQAKPAGITRGGTSENKHETKRLSVVSRGPGYVQKKWSRGIPQTQAESKPIQAGGNGTHGGTHIHKHEIERCVRSSDSRKHVNRYQVCTPVQVTCRDLACTGMSLLKYIPGNYIYIYICVCSMPRGWKQLIS